MTLASTTYDGKYGNVVGYFFGLSKVDEPVLTNTSGMPRRLMSATTAEWVGVPSAPKIAKTLSRRISSLVALFVLAGLYWSSLTTYLILRPLMPPLALT